MASRLSSLLPEAERLGDRPMSAESDEAYSEGSGEADELDPPPEPP